MPRHNLSRLAVAQRLPRGRRRGRRGLRGRRCRGRREDAGLGLDEGHEDVVGLHHVVAVVECQLRREREKQ